jgi:hypothetical protein
MTASTSSSVASGSTINLDLASDFVLDIHLVFLLGGLVRFHFVNRLSSQGRIEILLHSMYNGELRWCSLSLPHFHIAAHFTHFTATHSWGCWGTSESSSSESLEVFVGVIKHGNLTYWRELVCRFQSSHDLTTKRGS